MRTKTWQDKQGVAYWDVTVLARHAVSCARPPAAFHAASPHAAGVTDDDDRRQPVKQYWPIRRASNKMPV